MNLLLGISSSISAYKVCEVISTLKKEKINIQVVMSRDAHHFIGAATLEGLSGNKVHSSIFMEGDMMGHIKLARWADLIVLAPGSANQINRHASGLCDDLIGSLFLANNFKKPYWIYPAMNTQMYEHPATQKSLATLETWGVRVMPTNSGELACGEVGAGRLLEPKEIVAQILEYKKSL